MINAAFSAVAGGRIAVLRALIKVAR